MLTEKELAMLREIQSGSGRRDAPPCLDQKAELEYLLSEMIKMRASAASAAPEVAWSFRAKYGYLRGRFNYIAEPAVANLLVEIVRLGADNERLRKACAQTEYDVQQILGPALFGPDAPDGGCLWGEYVAAALAETIVGRLRAVEAERDALQAFKDWVHNYLDAAGVPHHPPGTHGAHGCRIGDRMDWLMERANLGRPTGQATTT